MHKSKMQKQRRAGKSNKTTEYSKKFSGIQGITGSYKNIRIAHDPVLQSKHRIEFSKHKGSFLKPCPGTPSCHLCCNYYVLNIQTNCNFDCHYCIMQGYINNEKINIYTNLDDALSETERFLKSNKNNFYRIGTGELTDSLSLDVRTGHSKIIVPFFASTKNALLELKTKSANTDSLLKLNPNGNTVVSWSLNPDYIIDMYENNTASLKNRLTAAKKCQDAGYLISFHLDPIILYSGWENSYNDLVDKVFSYIRPESIMWISIAGFRYPYPLKTVIQERFPNTKLFSGEMIRCKDGKFRYLRPIRAKAYKTLIDKINKYDADLPIYFCMESPVVWKDVFGRLPHKIDNLRGIFGDHIRPVRFKN